MAPDLAKQLIKNLLQEIVEDLTATEGTNDDYSGFSAIAWIESPCRNYATTLQGIVKLNPESVLSVLLFRLREHCKLFLNINSVPSPIKIKKLLVLCELILHSPEIVLNAKSKESLNIILNMQLYNKDIAMAKQMIVESLFEVARYLVLHGAKLNYTTATFKSILRLSQTVVPSLPIELRPKLVNKLYRTIVKFYTSNTKEYRELLLTGVDEAQKLMDILLSWKSNDIDNISLYGVLMPLCTRDLKLLNTKKGPFVSIMNTLSNFKQTKENHRTPISLAILEITNCVSLVSANENSLFHAFDEFLFSYKGKFEAWIFKDRKKQYFTGSLLGYFLPRYAALEFEKRQKTDGPACKKILQLVEKTQGYSCYVLFLRYIYDHYKQNKAGLKECEWQLMTLLSNKFQKAMLHLQTRKTDQEDFQRHSDFVRTAVQFLVGYNYKFSRYCMLSLYGNPDPSLRHANKQMDAFIHSNCGFDQIGAILASALPVYIQHFISNSAFLVKMYRAFLTLTDKWVNQLKDLSGKEAIKLLTDISITSKAMTEKAISINSPNLSSTPFLFYRFLKWAFMVMESTNSQQYLTPNHDFIKLNMSVILMLYSYSVDPIINSLNELMGVKLRSYGINFTYEFPLKDISPNDDVIIPAVKSIFLQWVSSTIRQIQAEEIAASDNPSQTLSNGGQFSFEPSREKISLMTIFLCRYIYFLSTVSFSSNESQPAEVRFIVSALKYIDKTNSKDIAFTKAFRNTNKESLPKIISNCKDLVLFKYQNLDFDNKIFWWNIIDLVTYTIESGQLENQENQEAVVNDIEEMIKIFISMVQINAFGESIKSIIFSIGSLLKAFYLTKVKKSLFLQRSVITTLIEVSIQNRLTKASLITYPIGKILEMLFNNFHFDLTDLLPNVNEISSKEDTVQFFSFVLCSFNLLIQDFQKSQYVMYIQKCIYYILINNTDYCWQLYFEFIKVANPLLKTIMMEALCTIYKTEIHSIKATKTKYIEKILKPSTLDESSISDSTNNSSTSKSKSSHKPKFLRLSILHKSKNLSNIHSSSESIGSTSQTSFQLRTEPKVMTIANATRIYKEIHTHDKDKHQEAHFIGKEHIYNFLTQNDFEIFRKPPINNVGFIRAIISCCIAYRIHDKVFIMMTNHYKKDKSPLNKTNHYSSFYTAWFKQIIGDWPIENFIVIAKVSKIKEFVNAINPNLAFVYYLQLFNSIIKDDEILTTLLIECFFRPILNDPKSYNKPFDSKKMDFNITEFIDCLRQHKSFIDLIKSILQAEPYYPNITTSTFQTDKEIVLGFMSKRPPVIDRREFFKHSVTHEIKKLPVPSLEDQIKLHKFNWVRYLGTTENGSHGYYLFPNQIPNISSELNLYYYFLHFSHMKKHSFELFINGRELTTKGSEFFSNFMKYMPEEFIKKLNKITVLNPSPLALMVLSQNPLKRPQLFNITNKFKGESKFYFHAEAFGDTYKYRGSFKVNMFNKESMLYIGVNQFSIEIPFEICGHTCFATQIIDINLIRNVTVNGKQLIFNTDGGKTFEINTNAGNYIKAAYESMISRRSLIHGISCVDCEVNVSNNHRAESIALCLYLLTSDELYHNTAIQLLESAINEPKNSLNNCDVFIKFINFGQVFKDIEKLGLIDEVTYIISNYLNNLITYDTQSGVVLSSENIKTLTTLLPLLVKFMNTSNDTCLITIIVNIMLKFIMNNEAFSILLKMFWNQIESRTALQTILPIAFTTTTYPVNSLRRIFQALMEKSSKLMGELIIYHYLDGTIRRKSFGKSMSTDKIFALIPSLPLCSFDFALPHLPYLLFCSVIAGIQAQKELADNVKNFINITLESISLNQPGQNTQKFQDQLDILLNNSNTLSALDFISFGEKVASSISKDTHDQYQKLMTEEQIGDNPNIWYIKAAAAVQHDIINYNTTQKYIELLPSLLSSNFGTLNLSLAFSTLTKLIDTFPLDSTIPIGLFWPTLISTAFSSLILRKSALTLLKHIIEYIIPKYGYKNVIEVSTTLEKSSSIKEGIRAFGDNLGIDFINNFPLAFIKTLNKALEDIETRKLALSCIASCLKQLIDNPYKASYFVLPFITYSNDDYNWILRLKFKDFLPISFPQIVYLSFDNRNIKEITGIATYLASKIKNTFCLEAISECLIYGVKKYPFVFASVREYIINKCWKMMETEQNTQIIDLLSSIVANFMAISKEDDKCICDLDEVIDDDILFTEIVVCVNGLGDLKLK